MGETCGSHQEPKPCSFGQDDEAREREAEEKLRERGRTDGQRENGGEKERERGGKGSREQLVTWARE